MSLIDWFRRRFSSAPTVTGAEDEAIVREEDGGETPEEPGTGFVAGGPTAGGLQGLEDVQAAEDEIHATDPPSDPAP
jgi:hypothetical protein